MKSTQPTIQTESSAAPARRNWPAGKIAELIATYEALPATGGARARWLREQDIASAQMSVWRKRARLGGAVHEIGIALAPAIVADSGAVETVVAQLIAQRDKLNVLIAGLRGLRPITELRRA